MEGSKEGARTWQVAFGLRDSCLETDDIDVVRHNIENFIKLSPPFGETTKDDVGNGVLGQEFNIARVEPLGFVKTGLAPVPLASPPRSKGQRLRNAAAVG